MTAMVQPIRQPPVAETLVGIRDLKKHFPVRRGILFERTIAEVKAVDGVTLEIARGETLGLVGESGCGKSTLARCVLALEKPTSGAIAFDGVDLVSLHGSGHQAFRRRVQAVFQDPFSSLNPRMTVRDIVGEPLYVHKVERESAAITRRVRELLDICGLPARLVDRYPLRPDFVVCDEAVSALDVSIQAQIIRLLEDLRDEFGLTYLFIGHDLSVVRHISHRVAVMYLGKIVEIADSDELFARPRHPYTQALLSAVPVPDPAIERMRVHRVVTGETPSAIAPPPGCVFHPRCPIAIDVCHQSIPATRDLGLGHLAACVKADSAEQAFS